MARHRKPVRVGPTAQEFYASFFEFHNHDHRHSGIALHTAASVHNGTATQIRELRQRTLDAAYATNRDRFSHGSLSSGGYCFGIATSFP